MNDEKAGLFKRAAGAVKADLNKSKEATAEQQAQATQMWADAAERAVAARSELVAAGMYEYRVEQLPGDDALVYPPVITTMIACCDITLNEHW